MFLHEALYLEPVMRQIEAFLKESQATVSGEVRIRLFPYRFTIEGIVSKYDRMQAQKGDYGEMTGTWSGEDVKGFTKILANGTKDPFS